MLCLSSWSARFSRCLVVGTCLSVSTSPSKSSRQNYGCPVFPTSSSVVASCGEFCNIRCANTLTSYFAGIAHVFPQMVSWGMVFFNSPSSTCCRRKTRTDNIPQEINAAIHFCKFCPPLGRHHLVGIPCACVLCQAAFVHRPLWDHVLVHHPYNTFQHVPEERTSIFMVSQ